MAETRYAEDLSDAVHDLADAVATSFRAQCGEGEGTFNLAQAADHAGDGLHRIAAALERIAAAMEKARA